jgi:hypothetical protein
LKKKIDNTFANIANNATFASPLREA